MDDHADPMLSEVLRAAKAIDGYAVRTFVVDRSRPRRGPHRNSAPWLLRVEVHEAHRIDGDSFRVVVTDVDDPENTQTGAPASSLRGALAAVPWRELEDRS